MLADQASDLNLDGQGPAELTEEHFRRAFLKGPEPGTITRLSDGVFLAANDAMLAATGYSREDFIGSTGLLLGIWKNASDRAEFVSRLQREGWVNGFERKLRRKDGRVWLHQLCARIVEIGGESYVVAAGRDVTEARKREDLVLQIAAGVADSTGEKFLQSLVGHLTAGNPPASNTSQAPPRARCTELRHSASTPRKPGNSFRRIPCCGSPTRKGTPPFPCWIPRKARFSDR